MDSLQVPTLVYLAQFASGKPKSQKYPVVRLVAMDDAIPSTNSSYSWDKYWMAH